MQRLPRSIVVCTSLALAATGVAAMFDTYTETSARHFVTGNELLSYGDTNRASVMVYVAGVVDRDFGTLLPKDWTIGYCIPTEATLKQIADVTLKYVGSHPGSRHMPAAYLTRNALKEAFPCSP